MSYTFIVTVANGKNSRAKDNPNTDYIPFAFNDVEAILDAQKNEQITDYWKQSIRALIVKGKETEIVDTMVSDIYSYYRDVFALDDENTSNSEIKVRLFLNQPTGGEHGDACKTEVRIFLKSIVTELRKKYGNIKIQEALIAVRAIYGDDTEWFLDYFRYVLAHELFHAFHYNHYFKVRGNNIYYGIRKQGVDPETGRDIILPDANCVLLEVLAEYFACAYMHRYLDSQDVAKTVSKWNTLRESPGKKYFGFLQEEIIKKFNDGIIPENLVLSVPKVWEEKGKPDPENNYLSLLDYAGGCLMYDKALEFGKQGRDYPGYKEVYNMILDGNSDEALYKVITLRANQ